MERFDYVKFEVYGINHAGWFDLTADVLKDPHPKGSRGIPGAGPIALIAMPGSLVFSLDNSSTNSAGKAGYYSLGHANTLTSWDTGLFVRLSLAYDSWQPYYKWYGRIDRDGIKVMPGTKGERRVEVTCHDFMQTATDIQLDLLQLWTNLYPYQAVQVLLDEIDAISIPSGPKTVLGHASPGVLRSSLQTGGTIFPTVFDAANSNTTVLGEFNKIALSALSPIFVKGDLFGGETFQYARGSSGSYSSDVPLTTSECGALLLETGDQLLLETGGTDYLLLDEVQNMAFDEGDIMEGSEFSYGKVFYNHGTITFYPREVDTAATTVLWKLTDARKVAAGLDFTVRGQYNDPTGGNSVKGTAFVTPVSGTDFAAFANADGTGANLTANMTMTVVFGAAEAEITIANTGGTDFYTGGASIVCQVRGKAIRFNDTVKVVDDRSPGSQYGTSRISVDMKYANDVSTFTGGRDTMDLILNPYDTPFTNADKLKLWANRDKFNMCAFLWCEPFTSGYITESMNALSSKTGVLLGYEFELFAGKDGEWNAFWYPSFDLS